ncbi:hypothetical protein GF357_03590 [Candidatus Dojkabacteria bacterium]|nr:hypothetical protein [Candidatus Dojkabacteria bacterium]
MKNFLKQAKSHFSKLKSSPEKFIIPVLVIGLVIRIILMPLFIHGDLAAEYWRAAQVLFNRSPQFFFKERAVPSLIHIITLWITSIFVPNVRNMFPATGITMKYYMGLHYAKVWQNFLSQPGIYLSVFMFKLPYLIFDLIGAYSITHFFKAKKDKIRSFALWMLNPIIIFTGYIWGRYDIILIVLTLLSFLYLYKKNYLLSLITFGLAVFTKSSVMTVAPFYLIYFLKDIKLKRHQIIGVFAGIAALFLGVDILLDLGFLDVVRGNHFQYFMQVNFATFHYTGSEVRRIYIYPALYLLLLLYYFLRDASEKERTAEFNVLISYILVSYLTYYILCFYHEHYFVWFVPFLILAWKRIKNISFVFWSMAAVFLYTFMFRAAFLFSKFIPWGSGQFSWSPALESFFEGFIYRSVAHLGPTVIIVFCVYILYELIVGFEYRAKNNALRET